MSMMSFGARYLSPCACPHESYWTVAFMICRDRMLYRFNQCHVNDLNIINLIITLCPIQTTTVKSPCAIASEFMAVESPCFFIALEATHSCLSYYRNILTNKYIFKFFSLAVHDRVIVRAQIRTAVIYIWTDPSRINSWWLDEINTNNDISPNSLINYFVIFIYYLLFRFKQTFRMMSQW